MDIYKYLEVQSYNHTKPAFLMYEGRLYYEGAQLLGECNCPLCKEDFLAVYQITARIERGRLLGHCSTCAKGVNYIEHWYPHGAVFDYKLARE